MHFRYEDLRVGDLVLSYTDRVYQLTGHFPGDERYALTQQIRKATTSVYLNLAEGSARNSKKDFARFITISLGSLVESHAGFRLALHRKYITDQQWDDLQEPVKDSGSNSLRYVVPN